MEACRTPLDLGLVGSKLNPDFIQTALQWHLHIQKS